MELILDDNNWITLERENASTGPAFLISMLNSLIAFSLTDLPAVGPATKSH